MQDDERVGLFFHLFLHFLMLLSFSSALKPLVAAQGLPISLHLAQIRLHWQATQPRHS